MSCFIRRNNPFLYKTGRAYGYKHEDTEDLMQETFVNAYLNLSKFESRASFKTWIMKIMLNNCFQKRQKFSFKNEKAGSNSINEKSAPMYSDTPLRKDAFEMSSEKKITLIQNHFREIMHIIGLDLTDDSLSGTPDRVAKMVVNEIFSRLDPANKPEIKLFDNKYKYEETLIEKNSMLYSYYENHFVPIIGKVHVAYISKGKVIGLSKINRLVK